jgi:hypothetical protein
MASNRIATDEVFRDKVIALIIAWTYLTGNKKSLETQKATGKAFLKLRNDLPKVCLTAPPVLYRVLLLKPANRKIVLEGYKEGKSKLIKLGTRPFASWSTKLSSVKKFASTLDTAQPLIIKKEIPKDRVVVDLRALFLCVWSYATPDQKNRLKTAHRAIL